MVQSIRDQQLAVVPILNQTAQQQHVSDLALSQIAQQQRDSDLGRGCGGGLKLQADIIKHEQRAKAGR